MNNDVSKRRKRNDREKIIGEGVDEQSVEHQCQIKQSEDPCLYGNNKHQQELGLGIHGGVAEKQTQIQITHIRPTAEDHAPDIHQQDAAEIEQIEPERTPDIFDGPSQGVVAEQGDEHQQNIAVIKCQRIGDQAPDLSLQNHCPVEDQQIIQQGVLGKLGHQKDQAAAKTDVEHQIGNAFVAVLEAETIEG